MPSTPNPTETVARDGALSVTDALKAQLLQPRRIVLKKRRPKSPYVFQVRRDISTGKAKPIEMLVAMNRADLEDGASASFVNQVYRSLIAINEEYEQTLKARRGEPIVGPDPLSLVQRESAAQATKDDAERAFIAAPMSAEALQRVLDADARYHAENDRFVGVVRSRLARLTLAVG